MDQFDSTTRFIMIYSIVCTECIYHLVIHYLYLLGISNTFNVYQLIEVISSIEILKFIILFGSDRNRGIYTCIIKIKFELRSKDHENLICHIHTIEIIFSIYKYEIQLLSQKNILYVSIYNILYIYHIHQLY